MTGGNDFTLARALACSAIDPALDGVLLFDPPTGLLSEAAKLFGELLTEAERRPPQTAVLGAHQSEDDLWTALDLRRRGDTVWFAPATGPLVQAEDDPVVLVVVPDLAGLGVIGQRAAVTLLDAPVAYLERHAHHWSWRPRTRWLAACAVEDVGKISEHLLDRFPIRVRDLRLDHRDDAVERLMAAWSGTPDDIRPLRATGELLAAIRNVGSPPRLSPGAAERVVQLGVDSASSRRMIALGRLARAVAMLEQAPSVTVSHVSEIARALGLAPAVTTSRPIESSTDTSPPAAAVQPERSPDRQSEQRSDPPAESLAAAEVRLPVRASDGAIGFGSAEVVVSRSAYPEDETESAREIAPLRVPANYNRGPAKHRGVAVGVDAAVDLTDVAWIPTLIRAAKFQTVRRAGLNADSHGTLILSPTDLCTYRRISEPQSVLALVLDHTCRQGWNWVDALASYLQWAYLNRAAICVIDVGAKDAPSEFRAERFVARSIRDPRVGSSLSRRRGRATPLAHGLQAAHMSLQHALQHGRSPASEAWLVIATDGLGNVPLSSSLHNEGGRWADEGVRDSMEIAAKLSGLDNVRRVVVPPPRLPHPEILDRLAEVMGATILDEKARHGY